MAGARRNGRATLTPDSVIEAAVGLADDKGLDAVSMRAVAELLGVVPMALYKHVADKEALLDGMVDHIVRKFAPTPEADRIADNATPVDWKTRVQASVLAARSAVQQHPWARRAIESRTTRTAAVLGHMERVTQQFLQGGLSPDLTHHAMHALGNRIWGFSPELFDEAATAAPRRKSRSAPALDPADFPAIIAVSSDARQRRPGATGCDEDFEFRFALDLLLDGIERLHHGNWASPSSGAA